jgi:dienelactone hydrolase
MMMSVPFVCVVACLFGVLFVDAKHGDLLNFTRVQLATKADMDSFLSNVREQLGSNFLGASVMKKVNAKFGVEYYHLHYISRDAFSNPIVNTAAVLLPLGTQDDKPTILYNHGTIAQDSEAPTSSKLCTGSYKSPNICNVGTSAVARASLWAMQGYSVILPDYEKLGEPPASSGFHPYCQRDSFSTSTEDLLTSLRMSDVNFDRRLVVAGYSEGGFATLAIHRSMDLLPDSTPFKVIASFPHAGPVDWKFQVKNTLVEYADSKYSSYWYVPYIIIGALQYRNRVDLYDEVFLPEYKSKIIPLYDRHHSSQQIESVVPRNGSIPFVSSLTVRVKSGKDLPPILQNLIVERNILTNDWVPQAPVFFCSGTEDEQVPVENTRRTAALFRDQGVKVQVDLFSGDHTANAQNCLLVLTRYISSVDWASINKDDAVVTANSGAHISDEQLYAIYSVAGVVILGAIWKYMIGYRGSKCPGPVDLWLKFLIACPCLVFILFVTAGVGLGVFGIYKSGWSVDVDTDFASYLDADSELKFVEGALSTARFESSMLPASTTGRRRLTKQRQQSLKYWTLDLFYQVNPESGVDNIFGKEALQEIQAVETKLLNFETFQSICQSDSIVSGQPKCTLPDSVVNIFYPEVKLDNLTNQVDFEYNGEGPLTNVQAVLQAWVRDGVFWYADKGFSATNLKSNFTRSRFRGGLPLKGYDTCCTNGKLDPKQKHETELLLQSLYDTFLTKINDDLRYVTVTWKESKFLTDYEVNEHLLHDAKLSIGSLLFVTVFIYFHILSLGMTAVAVFGILLSFPMAYFVFYVVAGIQEMMILNFVALFLIMGIGADDVFVLFDTFQQSKAIFGHNASLSERMKWSYRHASSAMLITTVTTVGSFYANLFSSVRVIREFGLFMGTVTIFNFFNGKLNVHTCKRLLRFANNI